MINSVSADSFESLTLTNDTPRNGSIVTITNDNNDANDVIIYRRNNSILKDYFCIMILLGSLSLISYILIKQKYN